MIEFFLMKTKAIKKMWIPIWLNNWMQGFQDGFLQSASHLSFWRLKSFLGLYDCAAWTVLCHINRDLLVSEMCPSGFWILCQLQTQKRWNDSFHLGDSVGIKGHQISALLVKLNYRDTIGTLLFVLSALLQGNFLVWPAEPHHTIWQWNPWGWSFFENFNLPSLRRRSLAAPKYMMAMTTMGL